MVFNLNKPRGFQKGHKPFANWLGRKHSLETKKLMSEKKKGISYLKGRTYENIYGKEKAIIQKLKLSKAHIGKKLTDIHKNNIGNSLSGDKSYLWKGGKSFEKYSKEWTSSLRKLIRKRDNYMCQCCGKKNCDLYVHHIDYNKKNSVEKNLISLCGSCHTKTNHKRRCWEDLISNFVDFKDTQYKEKWVIINKEMEKENEC